MMMTMMTLGTCLRRKACVKFEVAGAIKRRVVVSVGGASLPPIPPYLHSVLHFSTTKVDDSSATHLFVSQFLMDGRGHD